jgi:type VI secretion system secreted protein VgrG
MHALTIQGLDVDLRVVKFTGVEAVSQHFRFDVTFLARERDVVTRDVVGRDATLSFQVGEDVRHVHGIVSRIEEGEENKKTVAYRLTIVPAVHRLQLRRTSRIFQEMSVPDVIAAVLKAANVPSKAFATRLAASYAPREYCVQYRESDWDFIARLCEEEGITYVFLHEQDAHLLVFADAPAAYPAIPGVGVIPFRPASDALVSGEGVSMIRLAEQMVSDESVLRDYDFKKPGLKLEGKDESAPSSGLEVYDYPAEATDVDDAKRLAKLRLEEHATDRRVARGDANVPRLGPGTTFELSEHPLEVMNGHWLVVEVEHEGHEPGMASGVVGTPYGNQFRAVPATTPIRPLRVTHRPIVHGAQTAKVVGPAGEEIHVDEHGRIKVQFHWDRLGKSDDKSSCWMRVAQAWAGPAFGAVFIPRIGHEVLVSFLEGDPDRPLVTGSVYNGANVPPYALPAEKTKSTLKSNSSPGGGGFNELRFEDRKGQEEVFLHAQKDHAVVVLNDRTDEVGHDESRSVGNDRSRKVGANESIEVAVSRSVQVGANETDTIGANWSATVGANASVTVGDDVSVSFGASFTEAIAKSATISIGEEKEESVGKGSRRTVGADESVTIDGSSTTEIAKSSTTSVGGDATTNVDGSYALTVGESYQLECGDAKVTVKKNGDITIEGKKIIVKGSGPIEVTGSKLKVKSDGSVDVDASGTVQIKGAAVNVN